MKRFLFIGLVLLVAISFTGWADEKPEKKDPIIPLILNIIPGLGLGSFIMGDPAGGLLGLGGEVVGIGLGIYGFAYLIAEAAAAGLVGVLSLGYGEAEISGEGFYIMGAGIIVWGVTKVFEIVRPFWFASENNTGLAFGDNFSFTLVKAENNKLKPALLFYTRL